MEIAVIAAMQIGMMLISTEEFTVMAVTEDITDLVIGMAAFIINNCS